MIDGVDVRDVTLASLRRQIGIVTQETVLFDDTVANNIAYGAAGASPDAIEARGARGARPRVHHRIAERLSRRSSASAASACRAASGSGSRSPARS